MNKINLNFYDEKININIPRNFNTLKEIISKNFYISLEDVDELVMYYVEDDIRVLLDDQSKYQNKFGKNLKNSEITDIFLEISEKSKLYLKELENTKIVSVSESISIDSEREKIKNEIKEKERLLMELIENERIEKERLEREEKERLEREEKERLEREEKEREEKKFNKELKEKLKFEKEQMKLKIKEEKEKIKKEAKEEKDRLRALKEEKKNKLKEKDLES